MEKTFKNGSFRSAFDEGYELINFAVGEHEYLFVAEYDELPFVKGMLFVWDGDMWIVIADSGDKYAGENPPEPWKGQILWRKKFHRLPASMR